VGLFASLWHIIQRVRKIKRRERQRIHGNQLRSLAAHKSATVMPHFREIFRSKSFQRMQENVPVNGVSIGLEAKGRSGSSILTGKWLIKLVSSTSTNKSV
jgi:hypothetical protein